MGVRGQELGSCLPAPLPRYMGTVLLGACWGPQAVSRQGGRWVGDVLGPGRGWRMPKGLREHAASVRAPGEKHRALPAQSWRRLNKRNK